MERENIAVVEVLHQHNPVAKLLHIRQNNSELHPTLWITQRAYTFGILYIRFSRPENFESDRLAAIPALPNFGPLRDTLRMISLLRNARKLI